MGIHDHLVALARPALRLIRHSRGYSAVVIGSLAVGIWACATTFSVLDALWVRPPLGVAANTLVLLFETTSRHCASCLDGVSPETFAYWERAKPRSLAALVAYEGGTATIRGSGVRRNADQTVRMARVGPEFFALLGVEAQMGRLPDSADCRGGAEPVALLSDGLWRSSFGGRRGTLGGSVRIDDGHTEAVYSVVGVLPRGFAYPDGAKLWLGCLRGAAPAAGAGAPAEQQTLFPLGRLAAGATAASAEREMMAIARQRRLEGVGDDQGLAGEDERGVAVRALEAMSADRRGSGHWVFVGAVWLAFLVACANVANLSVIRALRREHEVAIRCALGARRRQIATQLVAESLALALLGGALGLALTVPSLGLASVIAERQLGSSVTLVLNGRVAAGAAALAVGAGALFGLAPMLHLRHSDVATLLRAGGTGVTQRRGQRRVKNVLVTAEVVLVVVLTSGSLVFARAYAHTLSVDVGFDAERVLLAAPSFDTTEARRRGTVRTVADQLLSNLAPAARGAPIAVEARVAIYPRYRGDRLIEPLITLDGPADVNLYDKLTRPAVFEGSPKLLQTLGIPIVMGRDLLQSDQDALANVVIVNEFAARTYWPRQNPIGKRLKLGPPSSNEPWMTVIGVARGTMLPDEHAVYFTLLNLRPGWPVLYRPLSDRSSWAGAVVLTDAKRTPPAFPALLRSTLRDALGPDTEVELATLRGRMLQNNPLLVAQRLKAVFLLVFAVVSTMLSLVGIQAIVVESVHQRTREVGVRLALGARPASVLFAVLREAVTIAAVGVAAGFFLVAALLTFAGGAIFGYTRTIPTGVLLGIRATDPLPYLGLLVVLSVIISAASLLPARRALSIDPIQALRAE